MSVEVANESGLPVDEPALAALARHVLTEMRIHPLAELSVLLVDAPTMADLHQRWLGEPGPTDVLAFPMDELRPPPPGSERADRAGGDGGPGPGLLGDVVLCPEVAGTQARQAGHAVADELDLLCAHGILHLLGFDHGEPAERATMFGLQDRLLSSWRATRPADGGAPAGTAPAGTVSSAAPAAPAAPAAAAPGDGVPASAAGPGQTAAGPGPGAPAPGDTRDQGEPEPGAAAEPGQLE